MRTPTKMKLPWSKGTTSPNGTTTPPSPTYPEKNLNNNNDGSLKKTPALTLQTLVMTMCVAMGGFIFGYDTGQISGFLEMPVFLERFGERTSDLNTYPSGFRFSNVRSGLIVGLVSSFSFIYEAFFCLLVYLGLVGPRGTVCGGGTGLEWEQNWNALRWFSGSLCC